MGLLNQRIDDYTNKEIANVEKNQNTTAIQLKEEIESYSRDATKLASRLKARSTKGEEILD